MTSFTTVMCDVNLITSLSRLLADLLGFGGALGIQVVVTALQADQNGLAEQVHCGLKPSNSSHQDQEHVRPDLQVRLSLRIMMMMYLQPSDSFGVAEFLHQRMVTVVLILLASLGQGAASQVSPAY